MERTKFSLADKVALVTGGRGGIGRAIAAALAGAGADVAVCDLSVADGALEAVAQEIRGLGRRSLAFQADVTQKRDVDGLIEKVKEELSAIDILVNSVGIRSGFSLLETPEDEWHRVMDTNLKSYYLCSQSVAKVMITQGGGSIINITSSAGIRGFAEMNTYNISKAGVIMLTKVLARDLARYHIRVNALAPSIIRTEFTRDIWADEKAAAREAARIPLKRLGEVEDLTGPAVFLASEASGYITGHTLVVDGGQLA